MNFRFHIFIIIISHYFEFIEKHFQNVIHIWTTSQTSQTSFFFVFNYVRSIWKIRVWIARFSSSSFERIFSTCFENVAFLILSLFSNQTLRNFIIISWLSITSFLHLNNTLILRYFSRRKKFYIHFNNHEFFTIEQYFDFTILCERRLVVNEMSFEFNHDSSTKKLCNHFMIINHEIWRTILWFYDIRNFIKFYSHFMTINHEIFTFMSFNTIKKSVKIV